jgi:mannose-6-phosphate isomerase-like protein (cupin superfamily)
VPERIVAPTVVASAGTLPKSIEEYVGRVNTGDSSVSIARMRSPQGWEEPAQMPRFDEYTLVLAGMVVVDHEGGRLEIRAGEAVHSRPGEWVRYSTPEPGGAECVAVCLPAFSREIVHRED